MKSITENGEMGYKDADTKIRKESEFFLMCIYQDIDFKTCIIKFIDS